MHPVEAVLLRRRSHLKCVSVAVGDLSRVDACNFTIGVAIIESAVNQRSPDSCNCIVRGTWFPNSISLQKLCLECC